MGRILSNCYFSWRTLKAVNNIFVSEFPFLTFFRYYHHIAQHYSQVQEYKVFVTTISADVFFFRWLTFLNKMVSVLVLSLLRSTLSREGTHGLPLRCTLKPTCTKQLTRYLSVNVFSFFIIFFKSMVENKLILSVFIHFFVKLAVQCMTQEEVAVIYISQAQELEAQGKYKEAERWFTLLSIPDCRPSIPILPRLLHPITIPPSLPSSDEILYPWEVKSNLYIVTYWNRTNYRDLQWHEIRNVHYNVKFS